MINNLLQIKNLTVSVKTTEKVKTIIQDVSFDIPELSISALVGASGSGKTTTGFSILKLLDPALTIEKGEIFFQGRDLLKFSSEKMRSIRGGEIGMVFQEPLNAFNPVFSIGYQIDEVLQFHSKLNKQQRYKKILDLLDVVGLPEPQRLSKNYPHQLSGGMRQRAMIAQAIAASPKLIIADEPTSNLDVTLQARIIELFKKLRKELKVSILLITHDLGMVHHLADEIMVMNNGLIVEHGKTLEVFSRAKDSYTINLIEASK